MNDKSFLDTNILVYAYDKHEQGKQKKAQSLLKESIQNDNAVLSTQVLGEFFCVVTKHIKEPMSVDEAHEIIKKFSIMHVVEIDLALVNRAIDTHKKYHISYWDSLIIAAAERADCEKIFSEDFNSGQQYHNVLTINPFKS